MIKPKAINRKELVALFRTASQKTILYCFIELSVWRVLFC